MTAAEQWAGLVLVGSSIACWVMGRRQGRLDEQMRIVEQLRQRSDTGEVAPDTVHEVLDLLQGRG